MYLLLACVKLLCCNGEDTRFEVDGSTVGKLFTHVRLCYSAVQLAKGQRHIATGKVAYGLLIGTKVGDLE